MTEQEFNKIESLLVALDGITKFERTQERITEALAILDRNKQLLLHGVSQQRELLEWLSNEDYFNISKDEISEVLEDWQAYNSNCG